MTYSKQIKELGTLVEKLGTDFRVYEFIDTWKIKYDGPMGMKRVEEVRDIVTLDDIYNQFVNKQGEFYDLLKITETFRSFNKTITSVCFEPIQKLHLYDDSYDEFHKNWNKIHPEISYEKYEQQENAKEGRLSELMAIYQEPYYKLRRNIRNIFA